MSYILPVDNCQPALGNALVDLLNTLPNKHRLNVIEYFEKVYNVRIHLEGTYNWGRIEFQSREHYIEWYLKWA